MTNKTISNRIKRAYASKNRIDIISVVGENGIGIVNKLRAEAIEHGLLTYELRCNQLDMYDFVQGSIVDLSKHLGKDKPTVLILDEVSDHSYRIAQKIIAQAMYEATAKTVVAVIPSNNSKPIVWNDKNIDNLGEELRRLNNAKAAIRDIEVSLLEEIA